MLEFQIGDAAGHTVPGSVQNCSEPTGCGLLKLQLPEARSAGPRGLTANMPYPAQSLRGVSRELLLPFPRFMSKDWSHIFSVLLLGAEERAPHYRIPELLLSGLKTKGLSLRLPSILTLTLGLPPSPTPKIATLKCTGTARLC